MADNRYRRAVRSLVADRYYLLTEIGAGGMGTVWRGRDRHTGQAVAVKLLHPHLRRDPVYAAHFRREADLATRLDSRHIVQVLSYGVDDGEPYIVMEFIEGQTLAELLRPGPLAPAAAAHIGVQIARALEEAHSKGVVHRDIKPGNVLIQPDGEIKVTDFGIARAEDSDTASETHHIGAAPYMAPERFSPQRFGAVDGRTDIYSLGVMLYEMLTGYPPFEGDTYELLHAILDEDPPDLATLKPELDPALTGLIQRCLAKQTSDRPATAAEVRTALQPLADASQLRVGRRSFLGAIASFVTAPLRLFRPRRGSRRSRPAGARLPALIVGAIAVVAVAAVAAAGYVLASGSGEDKTKEVAGSTPAVTQTAAPMTLVPVAVRCLEGAAVPLAQALGRCPTAKVTYSAMCPLGQACASTNEASGTPTLSANDATVALVDESGNLVIARQDGSVIQRLTSSGQIEQPAWSPDGRYLAYVSTQLVQPGETPDRNLYATQLRVVEPGNPANDWVVASSSQRPGPDDNTRRLIAWPRWSADGKSLLFLWPMANDLGDSIYQVDLPFADKNLDGSKLVKQPPAGDVYSATPLRRLLLSSEAFGYPRGYVGSFAVAPDGRLFVQFCDSKAATRQCGLGQYDGRDARVVVPLPRESFLLDAPTFGPGADDLYAYVYSAPNNDRLVRLNTTTGSQPEKVSNIDRNVTMKGPFLAPIAIADNGKAALLETNARPRTLSLVDVSNGGQQTWGKGHAPSWFVGGKGVDAPLVLPSELWVPPAAPPPAATPVPPAPMTVTVDVRRGGSPVGGAQVVALVDNLECATGTTDASGRLQLTVPGSGAAPACARPGATVTFKVNGQGVPNQVFFSPLASAQAPISLP